MGVMMAPVGSSGRWPAWTARVPSLSSRSGSKMRVIDNSSVSRIGTYTLATERGKHYVCCVEANRVRCLVVDDEPRIRGALVRVLETVGYQCVEAESAAVALALLEQ